MTTYFLISASLDRATVVDAKAGEEVSGIDIRLVTHRVLTISGVVKSVPEGASGVPVVLVGNGMQSTSAGPDGRFGFNHVQPGAYEISAFVESEKASFYAVQNLELDSSDLTNIELSLRPGEALSGTLQVAGDSSSAGPLEKHRVRLTYASRLMNWSGNSLSAEVDKDGVFVIKDIPPGKFAVHVDPMPENGYLKSVALNGAVAANDVVDLSRGAGGSTVKITLSRNAAQLSGNIQDQDGEPLLNHFVVVFLVQDPNEIKANNMTRVPPDGKYSIKGIRPGKYRLFAMDRFQHYNGEWSGFKEYANVAPEIDIKEGDRITKDLKPMEKDDANARPKE
jgi:hypothetical protein